MLKTFFVARLAVLTEVTRIKMAFALVHARVHPSVRARGCRQRAGYSTPSPAYPLHVKPLHCSTASGISAGTALFFFSTTLTIDRLNLGQIPPVQRASHSRVHTPRCRMLRSRERRAAESPHPQILMEPLSAPHEYPPPFLEWDSCWSTCLGNRQRKIKHEVLEGSAVQAPSSRLCCNLFKAETFLFVRAAATPFIKPVIWRVWGKRNQFFLVGNTVIYIYTNTREGKKKAFFFKSCYL